MKRIQLLALFGSILAIAVGLQFLPVRDWFRAMESYIIDLGALGPIVVSLGYVLTTVLCIPGSAITIGIASLFGFRTAFLVVFFGANAGALCAFLLSRTLLREVVTRWGAAHPKFRSLDRAIDRQGFTMVLLLRLSPALPFNLLNYLLGLTSIRAGAYILANLIGMLPGMFLYVYLGAVVRDTLIESAPPAFKYIGLLASVVLVILITRLAGNAIRQRGALQENAAMPGRLNPDAH